MRIAMVGPFGFHPNKTMHSRAFNLARELVQRGHTARLFMPPWQTPAEADKAWEEDGVLIRYIPLRGGVAGVTHRLVRETLVWQPDVVHCFKPKAYSGLAGWWLWQFHRNRIRLVMDTDDWEGWGGWNELAPYSPLQKHFFAWQERWGMAHNHALTVASRALETIALSMGIAPERIVYVPNGPGISEQLTVNSEQLAVNSEQLTVNSEQLTVNSEQLTVNSEQLTVNSEQLTVNSEQLAVNSDQSPTLLVYSRLFEFDTGRLTAILRGVKTAVPNVTILMIGAGLYEADAAQFRGQLADAGLADSVVDRGWVRPAELPGLLALADAAIYLMDDTLLNRTKCPAKLADMAAAGVPVVAEAVGQVNEYVVDGRTGFLHPVGDINGISANLVALLQNREQREQFSKAAQSHIAAHFNWAGLAARVERAYTQINIG